MYVEPVDESIVGRRRRPGLAPAVESAPALVRLARRRRASVDVTTSRAPSGDHSNAVDAARQVGQAARLAAVERQQVDLVCGPRDPSGRSARSGSSSTIAPPVREERERAAVGREAGMAVVPRADRQLARRRAPRRSGRATAPRGSRRSRARRSGASTTTDRPSGDRRGSVGDAQAVQVVGARRSGHRRPPGEARDAIAV